MSADVISILALAAIFSVAIAMSVNMGLLAFAAAFLVGTLAADMTADDIFGVFPGDIFVVLVGITYLFAIAQRNGTVDWIVKLAMRAVGGRVGAIPWIMFAIAGVLTAIGAVSPAAVAIVAPVALGFAVQFGINPLLMGVMVVHGAGGRVLPDQRLRDDRERRLGRGEPGAERAGRLLREPRLQHFRGGNRLRPLRWREAPAG
jgi:di/tricarboxylate transporter